MDRAKLHRELIRDEGLRNTAYKDTNGFWTIGIGHLIGEDPGRPGQPRMWLITTREATALLDLDIEDAVILARRCVPLLDRLSDVRQRALVNMAFNRGGHMVDSKTITPAINAAAASGLQADWDAVERNITASPWAKKIGARALRLAAMLSEETEA